MGKMYIRWNVYYIYLYANHSEGMMMIWATAHGVLCVHMRRQRHVYVTPSSCKMHIQNVQNSAHIIFNEAQVGCGAGRRRRVEWWKHLNVYIGSFYFTFISLSWMVCVCVCGENIMHIHTHIHTLHIYIHCICAPNMYR